MKTRKTLKTFKPLNPLSPLNPLIAIIFILLTTSMVKGDRKERVRECASKSGAGAIYLREFVVDLPRTARFKSTPVYRKTVILRGNNIYRFNLCNEKGEAVIRIYDSSNMLISSFDPQTKQNSNSINFLCRKTAHYTIIINFKGSRSGKAVGIMSHVLK